MNRTKLIAILLCLMIGVVAITAGPLAGYVAIESFPDNDDSNDSPFGEALAMLITGVNTFAIVSAISMSIGIASVGIIVQEFLQD